MFRYDTVLVLLPDLNTCQSICLHWCVYNGKMKHLLTTYQDLKAHFLERLLSVSIALEWTAQSYARLIYIRYCITKRWWRNTVVQPWLQLSTSEYSQYFVVHSFDQRDQSGSEHSDTVTIRTFIISPVQPGSVYRSNHCDWGRDIVYPITIYWEGYWISVYQISQSLVAIWGR